MKYIRTGIKVFLAAVIFAGFISCQDHAVKTAPPHSDLVGTWVWDSVPGNLKSATDSIPKTGALVLNSDGTYTANGFPLRSPLRFVNRSGNWEVIDGSMTPSGKYSIEMDGIFLSIRRRGDRFVLHHAVDVLNDYRVDYVKP
jgi:hypothetical protein